MGAETWIVLSGSLATVLGIAGSLCQAQPKTDRLGGMIRPTALGLLVWWLGVVFAALHGWFQARPDLAFPMVLLGWVPALVWAWFIATHHPAKSAVQSIPQSTLVGLQTTRLVGLAVLWSGWEGRLPGIFAYPAGAGGLGVGLAAPWVAWQLARRAPGSIRRARIWNLFGVLDIAVAMVLGGLTGPGPNQVLSREFPSAAATAFPLVVTPAFLIPLYLLGHFLVWRSLRGSPGGT